MKETSPDGPYIDRLRSWAQSKVHGGNRSSARRPGTDHQDPNLLPLSSNNNTASPLAATSTPSSSNDGTTIAPSSRDALGGGSDGKNSEPGSGSNLQQNSGSHIGPEGGSQSSPSPPTSRKGSQLGPDAKSETTNEKPEVQVDKPKLNRFQRFFVTGRKIVFSSWLNLLLVFVPVGIAVEFIPGMSPGVIFGMNAIAIIPLAGLLSLATETVAHRMGDAIGALMNITFGNAVELIILYVYRIYKPRLSPSRVDPLGTGSLGVRKTRLPHRHPVAPLTVLMARQAADQDDSMYVCLVKMIKTRKREKPQAALSNRSSPISLILELRLLSLLHANVSMSPP